MMFKGRVLFYFMAFTYLMVSAEEKKFVIHISSYKNARYCQQTLDSIFSQKYPKNKFRVIFSDNGSSDGTYEFVEKYVKKYNLMGRFKIVKQPSNARMISHYWSVFQGCKDNEIIIPLKCGDWLAHDYALARLNRIYQDQNIWMTCNNYRTWPLSKIDPVKPISQGIIKNNLYRKLGTLEKYGSHLITHYAWLGKQIKLEDFILPNKIFQNKAHYLTAQWGVLYPLFEMGSKKCFFDTRVLLVKNSKNQNNHTSLQRIDKTYEKSIRQLSAYKTLTKLNNTYIPRKIPLIIFVEESNRDDAALLNWSQNQSGIKRVHIMSYRKDRTQLADTNFKHRITEMKILKRITEKEKYIAVVKFESSEIHSKININYCLDVLSRTSAYAFYHTTNPVDYRKISAQTLFQHVMFFLYKNFVDAHFNMDAFFCVVEADAISTILDSLPSMAVAEDFLDDWFYVDPPAHRIGLLKC